MPITIKDINDKVFTKQVRGYSIEEVDDFLDELAGQMEILIRENQALARQLTEMQQAMDAQTAQTEEEVSLEDELVLDEPSVEEAEVVVQESEESVEEPVSTLPATMADIESQYYRNLRETLLNAQLMADSTVAEARKQANALIAEAEEKAAAATSNIRADLEAAQTEYANLRARIADYRARFQLLVEEQMVVLNADASLFEE